jgi:hypothetical protein
MHRCILQMGKCAFSYWVLKLEQSDPILASAG